MTAKREVKATAGIDDLIIRYFYHPDGKRYSAVCGSGTIGFATNYYYDAALRLSTLANTLPFPGAGPVVDLAYVGYPCTDRKGGTVTQFRIDPSARARGRP
jgi:hypothetical protein